MLDPGHITDDNLLGSFFFEEANHGLHSKLISKCADISIYRERWFDHSPFYNKQQLHSVNLFIDLTMCGLLTMKDSKQFNIFLFYGNPWL